MSLGVRTSLTALAALVAGMAFATSVGALGTGEITRASSDEEWSMGSFAGSVSWSLFCPDGHIDPGPGFVPVPHEPPRCAWTPFATAGPGEDQADCAAPGRTSPTAPGPGVTVVWVGSEVLGAERAPLTFRRSPSAGIRRRCSAFRWLRFGTIPPCASPPKAAVPSSVLSRSTRLSPPVWRTRLRSSSNRSRQSRPRNRWRPRPRPRPRPLRSRRRAL